jgi:hypothetical protein
MCDDDLDAEDYELLRQFTAPIYTSEIESACPECGEKTCKGKRSFSCILKDRGFFYFRKCSVCGTEWKTVGGEYQPYEGSSDWVK